MLVDNDWPFFFYCYCFSLSQCKLSNLQSYRVTICWSLFGEDLFLLLAVKSAVVHRISTVNSLATLLLFRLKGVIGRGSRAPHAWAQWTYVQLGYRVENTIVDIRTPYLEQPEVVKVTWLILYRGQYHNVHTYPSIALQLTVAGRCRNKSLGAPDKLNCYSFLAARTLRRWHSVVGRGEKGFCFSLALLGRFQWICIILYLADLHCRSWLEQGPLPLRQHNQTPSKSTLRQKQLLVRVKKTKGFWPERRKYWGKLSTS